MLSTSGSIFPDLARPNGLADVRNALVQALREALRLLQDDAGHGVGPFLRRPGGAVPRDAADPTTMVGTTKAFEPVNI